jgi:hypothetical protein
MADTVEVLVVQIINREGCGSSPTKLLTTTNTTTPVREQTHATDRQELRKQRTSMPFLMYGFDFSLFFSFVGKHTKQKKLKHLLSELGITEL